MVLPWCFSNLSTPRTCLTFVLIVKDLILAGLQLKRGVKTVLGSYSTVLGRVTWSFMCRD